jgi:hypothetical protein
MWRYWNIFPALQVNDFSLEVSAQKHSADFLRLHGHYVTFSPAKSTLLPLSTASAG